MVNRDVLVGFNIVPILLDPGAHKVDFALVQEFQAESAHGVLGKVDNDEVGSDAEDASKDTLEDEDPAPSGDSGEDSRWGSWVGFGWAVVLSPPDGAGAVVLQLTESVGKDTGKGRGHGSDEVEDGIALLKLVARIPAAEKIGTAWSWV